MNEKKKALLADFALLLAAVCWGGGFIAGDIAVEHFSTFYILTLRFLSAALVTFLFFGRIIKRCGKAEIKYGLTLGIFFAVSMPLQIIGLKYTTPSKQAFLVAGYAALVPFFSWLILKKRPKITAFFAGILVLIGIGLITLNNTLTIHLGDSLSLGFGIAYAIFVVLTGIFAGKCNPIGMSFFSYLGTGVFSLFVALLFEEFPASFPKTGLLALAYLATVSTAVAFTLQNVAQKFTSDSHAALFLSMESIFAFIFGVFLYGDPFTPRLLIGGLIVFSAVIISEFKWKKHPKTKEDEQIETQNSESMEL
ncbi:MAG: DMT family transporter [Anaerotignum sp.]|nr:DMT family transporter [Anaerotignum sp.]